MKLLSLLFLPFALWGFELTVWHELDANAEEKLSLLVAPFEKSTGHKVVFVRPEVAEIAIVQQALTTKELGEAPDLLLLSQRSSYFALLHAEQFSFPSFVYPEELYFSFVPQFPLSLPWTGRAGVIYYNKYAFARSGLSPEKGPKDWAELEYCADSLRATGFCGFTTPFSIPFFLEHFCAIHNLPFVTNSTRFCFDGQAQLTHWKKLANWARRGVFHYCDRTALDPRRSFTAGECAMLFDWADSYESLQKKSSFPIGVAQHPYARDLVATRYQAPVDCFSFWTPEGGSPEEKRALFALLSFLFQKETLIQWHLMSNFLPLSKEVYHHCVIKGLYENRPALSRAIATTIESPTSSWTKAPLIPYYAELRESLLDHFEMMIRREESPELALSNAVREGNELLEFFMGESP